VLASQYEGEQRGGKLARIMAANHSSDLPSRPTASIRMILKMAIVVQSFGVVGLLGHSGCWFAPAMP
jgi:hypothetical protein